MPELKDQLGRWVRCEQYPQRIVSLVPSQTELLFDLGLEEQVVGITKFCVHPKHWKKTKTIVGGTKQFRKEELFELAPDLVIANKEENTQEMVAELQNHAPVYVSDVNDLPSALGMIKDVGHLTHTANRAERMIAEIQEGFHQLQQVKTKRKALYLIWKNPYMAAGCDTFIHDMMNRSGFENAIHQSRYPEVSEEEIVALNPEIILLSSEPFPFQKKHIRELEQLLPESKVVLVDGEVFSWYGSRLLKAAGALKNLQQDLL